MSQTRSRRQEATRAALIAAAAEAFAELGYEAATLDGIAALAGFTKGAVYANFDGKEDLFRAVAGARDDALLTELRVAANRRGRLPDLLGKAWASSMRRARTSAIVGFEFRLHAVRDPEAIRQVRAWQRESHQQLAQFIDELAAEHGIELPHSAERLAPLVAAVAAGLTEQYHVDSRTPVPALFADFLELVLSSGRRD